MTETLRECTIYPATVRLEARDQYNDYSVLFDHTLIVTDKVNAYSRRWQLGTDPVFAVSVYDAAIGCLYLRGWETYRKERSA